MALWAAGSVYTRLSRAGISGVDRVTARFLMGANHYLLFALGTSIPFMVALAVIQGGALWPAAIVHAGLVVAWASCFALNAKGLPRVSAVLGLVAPLVAYTAQTLLLSGRSGFLLPMLMTSAVSFVTIAPSAVIWRALLTLGSSAAVAWSYLDSSLAEPLLDASPTTVRGLLIANVALATFIIGSTSWLNDFFFTRERLRAESRLNRAESQARTDSLTQLANRRGMVEALASVHAQRPYAVSLVDLDRFKSVNDNNGHAFGDEVLTEVARVLSTSVGDMGVVSRWGGEEFLVLLPEARLTAAVGVMERARKAVEQVTQVAGRPVEITMSAGLAAATGALPWETAIRVADALLYDAKDAGRNRIRYAQVRADANEWDA